MDLPAAPDANGIAIHVRLMPKSGTARIAGVELYGEKPVLKAHVTAPPEDGKANAALHACLLPVARRAQIQGDGGFGPEVEVENGDGGRQSA